MVFTPIVSPLYPIVPRIVYYIPTYVSFRDFSNPHTNLIRAKTRQQGDLLMFQSTEMLLFRIAYEPQNMCNTLMASFFSAICMEQMKTKKKKDWIERGNDVEERM